MTTEERFGTRIHLLQDNYDSGLIHEVLTVVSEYAASEEARYLGRELMLLLRLIRTNPARLISTREEYAQAVADRIVIDQYYAYLSNYYFIPTPQVGFKLYLNGKNPLYRLLACHFPREHRIWRYVGKAQGQLTPITND